MVVKTDTSTNTNIEEIRLIIWYGHLNGTSKSIFLTMRRLLLDKSDSPHSLFPSFNETYKITESLISHFLEINNKSA